MVRATLIELAVRVLRAAVEQASSERVDGAEVRLALRVLLLHAGDRALLIEFWSYAGQPHNANRAESCDAVLAAIVEKLRAAGRYPDAAAETRRLLAEGVRYAAHEREVRRSVQRRHYWGPPQPRQRP